MFASAIEFYDQLICLQKNTRHRGHKRQNIHRSGVRERRTERQRQGHGERRGRETRRERLARWRVHHNDSLMLQKGERETERERERDRETEIERERELSELMGV